jgi:hypothetical protein
MTSIDSLGKMPIPVTTSRCEPQCILHSVVWRSEASMQPQRLLNVIWLGSVSKDMCQMPMPYGWQRRWSEPKTLSNGCSR